MTQLTIPEAERQVATLLCRLVNLQERTRVNMAPDVSDTQIDLARLDLRRAEKALARLRSRECLHKHVRGGELVR